jgi:hypothetical protein
MTLPILRHFERVFDLRLESKADEAELLAASPVGS